MNEEVLNDEEIVMKEDNERDLEERDPEKEPADADKQNGEVSSESVSLELQNVTKDYLDPSLMNGIRIVESSELFDIEETEAPVPEEEMDKYIETFSDIAQNQIITGRVIGQNEKEIIMDIGFKSEGIIPRSEFSGAEPPNMGDTIEVYLEKIEDINGQTVLSKEKAVWMKGWLKLIQIQKEDGTVNGTIIRRIKGGFVVDVDGIQAFLPGSQIDVRPVQEFDSFLGQEMEFKIVKINQLRKNVVLSRKALLYNALKEQRESLFDKIATGQIIEGVVKNITDFGVFVDLGGIDGLLHITDLSWGRVNHPSEMTEVGETISVKIIDIDREKQRISLGLKQLTPHPWESVENKYPVGTKIFGKVVSLTNYGAFVELETGVEGLVHISEMSWTRSVHRPDEVVQMGEEVEAHILSVDPKERKIALGFKQLQPDPWEGVDERYVIGSTLKGTVRNLTQFGAFVELEEGVDGLIHVSDLSWTKVVHHPKEILRKGDEVEVKVLEVSRENHRIGLSLKHATEDPWDDIISHFEVGKTVEGKVFRLLDKGIIVELEMDVEGIIPADALPSERKKQIMDGLKQQQQIQCEVVEVKPEDKKIVLSLADGFILTESPAEEESSEAEEEAHADAEIDDQQPESDEASSEGEETEASDEETDPEESD
ncbi:MAG: 30S ribosomal protein S1 [Candidatus Neomarinimicrobiota bacterium]|nr:30S ribosomal protein S1 [Candidatus Neomarinimicrobiota bacterium]